MTKGLHHIKPAQLQKEFEQQYISLRQKEGRLYADEEVAQLPFVAKDHSLKKEWEIREFSCKRLMAYLAKKKTPLNILEIGCGNGWLSAQLSSINAVTVNGLDINETELAQAKRVFSRPNLSFLSGDIRDGIVEKNYDAIVFAASFQYFNSAPEILNCCLTHLKKDGEIHIIDTKFYSKEEAFKAAKSSAHYFNVTGFPSMSHYYFHHHLDELSGYKYQTLYQPKHLLARLLKRSPFPWICIKK